MKNPRTTPVAEPRDQFTLELVRWIQEALSSGPKVPNGEEQAKEYFRLLETPLEAFEP
jgi:hypothetical protein